MKNLIFLFVLLLALALLAGCQPVKETIKAEETSHEEELFLSETLIEIREITHVEISKTKGINPIVFEEAADLAAFDEIFASAVKEPGIFNMGDPAFFIRVSSDSGEKQFLYLYIGDEGGQAALMREDDTHTLYSLSAEMSRKLYSFVNK